MVMMVKMKMMLVDDEERFLQATAKMLIRLGYDAVTASSGMACLQKRDQDLINVVIRDVKMPGLILFKIQSAQSAWAPFASPAVMFVLIIIIFGVVLNMEVPG